MARDGNARENDVKDNPHQPWTLPAGCKDQAKKLERRMVDPRKKPFRLAAEQIKPLATGFGSCIATDMITVDGRRVAFMYREVPDNEIDSGWRFMSGAESEEYMDDADNHAVYDVNTIANYDPEIIPYLDAPVGSAFEREHGTGPFLQVLDFNPPDA